MHNYVDKNGVPLTHNSVVLVPKPNKSDDHKTPFQGRVISFLKHGKHVCAVVRAPDGDNYHVEIDRLEVDLTVRRLKSDVKEWEEEIGR